VLGFVCAGVTVVTGLATVSAVPDQTMAEDTVLSVEVRIDSNVAPPPRVSVAATSSQPTVVPNSGLVLSGSGRARTLTITPAPDATGQTLVTLTASDGVASSSESFLLTVTPVNDPPVVTAISDVSLAEDTQSAPIAFSVSDPDADAALLSVGASSSNQAVVPDGGLTLDGAGGNRTVTILPAPDATGTSTITITVQDGAGGSAVETFAVLVTGVADPPTLGPLPDALTAEDTAVDVPLAVGDVDTPLGALVLDAALSNPALIAPGGVTFDGTGATRILRLQPASDAHGTTTVTVSVSDGAGGVAQGGFSLEVSAVNDAPAISAIPDLTIDEDTDTGPVAFTIGDVDSAALEVTASSSNPLLVPAGNLMLSGAGAARTIRVTPQANQVGSTTITVTVTDELAAATSEAFVVTVNAADDPPTLSPLTNQVTDEDQPTSDQPLAVADPDDAPDTLVLSAASSNPALIPAENVVFGGAGANRTVRVVPAAHQTGIATITVTVSDGTSSDSQAFDVAVNPVNDPPIIVGPGDQVTSEDTPTAPIPFVVDDVDHLAASLSVTAAAADTSLLPAAALSLGGAGSQRTLQVTPPPNVSGETTITLTVSDETASAFHRFTFRIVAVNDAPSLAPLPDQSTDEDVPTAPFAFTVVDADDDPGALTLSGTTSDETLVPSGNIVFGGTGTDRTVQVTPAPNRSGSATITVIVSDGRGGTGAETFVLTVNAVNDAPAIAPVPAQNTLEDTPLVVPLTIADVDSALETLSLTASADAPGLIAPSALVLGGSGGSRTLTITPVANRSGQATIRVVVSDGVTSSSAAFTLTITAVDDAPTITAIPNQQTAEGTATGSIAFTIGDADNAADAPAAGLTLSAATSNPSIVPADNVVFGGSGPARTVTVTPSSNMPGVVEITITVSDGVLSAASSFLLTVAAVNDGPSISDVADQSVLEDVVIGPLAFTVSDSDHPAEALTVTAISSNTTLVEPAGLVLGGAGGNRTMTLTPAANQSGTATISVTVSDGSASATDQFVVIVTPVNDFPTVSAIAPQTIDEDTASGDIAFTIADVDHDPAALTVGATSSNEAVVPAVNVTFGGAGAARTVRVVPAADASGTTTIGLTVTDPAGALVQTSFSVTVRSGNDTPTITVLEDITIAEDTATPDRAFTVGDAETAADTLAVSASSSQTALIPLSAITLGGTGASRTVRVTPVPNGSGTATITVTVSDGSASASEVFVVTVEPANDAPTIAPPTFPNQSTDEDAATPAQSFTIDDIDHAIETLVVSAASANPTLVPEGSITLGGSGALRTISVMPAANESGAADVVVSVSDGVATTTAAFTVTVNPVNDPPVISPIADQVTSEDSQTPAMPFTVSDVDHGVGTLTVSASSSLPAIVSNASIVLGGADASRTIQLTPEPDAHGTTTIIVTVSDPAGASRSEAFTLTVQPSNDPPAIDSVANRTINEDTQTAPITFSVADGETPADALVVSASSSNPGLVPNLPANLALSGSGASRTLVVAPAPNQSGSATITLLVTDADGGTASTSFTLTVNGVNDPPTLSPPFAPVTVAEDAATPALAFTVGDPETPAAALTLTASSSNAALVPASAFAFAGSGPSRTLVVQPAANGNGAATITVTVSDGSLSTQRTFALTVTPVADPPVIGPIPDQQTPEDTASAPVPFTVSDPDNPAGNAAQGLTLSATSSVPTLVPNGAIVFGGSGMNRTVTLVPEFGQAGATVITITVTDQTGLTAVRAFGFTVSDVPCEFTLTPISSLTMPPEGGIVTLAVATRQGCAWTAASAPTQPWLTVTAPASGSFGNGGVVVNVAANPTASTRSGVITVGSAQATVTQQGLACTYGLSVEPSSFPATGGAGELMVTAPAGCAWTVSGGAPWIAFGSVPPSGSGAGQVSFAVGANLDVEARSAVLDVAGQPVEILQSTASTTADSDGDGLPDLWELQFGLDPHSIALEDGPAGDPDNDGVSNLQELRDGTHPRGFLTRMLAEGATGPFFDTLIALANPHASEAARVLLRFLMPGGGAASTYVVVPPRSRRTVTAESVPGLASTAFSTTVESDVAVIVDRTMTWDDSGYGAHSESSLAAARTRWYFAEGATHSGFDLFYLLQNPSPTEHATVEVTYLRPSPLPPLVKQYALPPASRSNIWVDAEEFPPGSGNFVLSNADVSAVIEVVDGPAIAAERAMYLSRPGQLFAAGHASAGIPEPATDWFLPEGATGDFFDEFVLVANPHDMPTSIRATFLLPDGRWFEQDYVVGAKSRFNLWLDVEEIPQGSGQRPLADTAVSTVISSLDGVPVIVERAMWWPGNVTTWSEAHNAPGTTTTGLRWGMAEGEVGGSSEASTYVLIANPSPVPAQVKVTLLFENGSAERTYTLAPRTRFNVDVGTEFAGQFSAGTVAPLRFGALVESLAPPGAAAVPIVVERAMYWNSGGQFWAAGADALATKLQ
jgi:hypothetical protein